MSCTECDDPPISIVLVDDHEPFLNIAVTYLRRLKELAVVGAYSSSEVALREVPRLHPQVVLMDLNMPEVAGLDAIPQLRRQMPNVGIVALTAWDGDAFRRAALGAGADGFVTKSEMITDLLPTLQAVVEARGLHWPTPMTVVAGQSS